MAPAQPNKPKLRTFSFPLTRALPVLLGLAFGYWITHSVPGTIKLGRISLPFEYGILRTVVKLIVYLILPVHVWEANTAYHLCIGHRAPILVTVLYTLSTFIFGFPILNEINHQIQLSRTEAFTRRKST